MAEIVISIAAKVSEYLVDPIGRQINYAFKYQRNMEELKKQVKMLINQRESVQHSVDKANRQGDEIEKQVQEWLDSVDEFVKKVVKSIIDDQLKVHKLTHERESVQHSDDEAKRQGDEIEKQVREWLNSTVVKPITDDSVKANKLCSTGFCPNLMTRYSLSKKAVKTAKDGVHLLGEGKFQKVSYRLPPRRTNSINIKVYEAFASRMSLSERIMEALADANTNLIGVYGMAGVGKTTLVKKVAQQAKENKLFDLVVTAVVTETPDIRKIQDQIADELGLEFQQESESGRAARLRERMKKENRILVILDNVCAKLDLESIGIPIVGDEKGSITQKVHQKEGENANKKQCKIMLTSRRLVVLRYDMNIQKNFKVDVLSNPEAESLFWNTVGYSEEKSDLIPIAVEIVRKCAGLPVAIKTIAYALKNKSLPSWKTARDQLKKGNPKNIRSMDAHVYSTIESSFNFLKGEEAKSLFLLCSLLHAGHSVNITDMLKYSMGLGLFQDVDTIEEGRNKLHSLIDDLKTSCLLMDDDYDNNYVKMHDVLRVVAVSIASTTKLWFNLQDAAGLKEELEKKLPKDSAAVTLQCRDIHELPEKIEFPKLELFWLNSEDASFQIPDALFEGTKGLKVLAITGIHLLSPPSSLGCLTILHTLCLDQCQLEDVAIIGELKELEILSFQYSDIEQLPREIGQLRRLRLLDLSHCSKLKVIKPNVISSLTRLEELYMGDSFDQWDIEGQSNASLAELKQLSCLTALDIHVPDAQIIPQDLSFGKLERYLIFVGEVWNWSDKCETSRTLKLKLSSSIYLSNEIKSLLNGTEDELSGEGFPQLKHLHVHNGFEIQNIANSFGWGLCNAESLFLDNLINLEKICHAQVATKSFSKLRIMKVRNCDQLKHLFSFSMVNNLLQLQEIEVTNCKKLEEIISKENMEVISVIEEETVTNILFPNLYELKLINLQELKSFCNLAGNAIELPSLATLWIENCSNMQTFISNFTGEDMSTTKDKRLTDIQPLFDEKVGFPSLEKMVISGMDNLESIWHNQFLGDSFYKLKSVEVNDCQELKTIFPSCICERLLWLESLTVKSCGSAIEIFDLRGINLKEKHSVQTTPQLRELYVDHMSNLKHIWNEDPKGMLSFEKLEKVTVFLCPNLENLFPASIAKSFLNLDSLEVSDCGVEEIIAKEGGVKEAAADRFLFPQLSSLQLHNLPRLRTFYPGHTVEGPCLKRLGLHHCDKVTLFISEFLGFYETIEEGQLDISIHEQPPFFLVQEIEGTNQHFPNLEELQLSGKAMAMRWLSQVPGHVFCSLKSLELNDHESTVVPLDFIQRFGNLEKLSLNSSSYNKEIFSYGKDKEHPEIKHLVLSGFFDLKQIWKQGSKIDPNFQNLQILEVRSCFNLINLMPSSASFRNLMILKVWGCDRLKNLLTSSTAKSLVLLEKLEVFDCKMLTEVVANDGAVREEIVFGKLKSLSLVYLQSLASFCSAKHTLNFPILESLVVNECPEMKIFSKGVTSTSTPKLNKLELNWKAIEDSSEVSVNTTIQQNMDRGLLGR